LGARRSELSPRRSGLFDRQHSPRHWLLLPDVTDHPAAEASSTCAIKDVHSGWIVGYSIDSGMKALGSGRREGAALRPETVDLLEDVDRSHEFALDRL
jgi:hypothetical protein